jgi:glycosyltransferase involved in cell wall biosynthesis
MKITVIIPTFNRDNFISKTIDSILNQTYKVNEIIIIDDGSSDNTKKFIEQYPLIHNIKYIYQKNQGVSSARNLGIKFSNNEWIAFLDSDDIWCNDKIAKQKQFHENNLDILFSYTDELWKFNNKVIKQNKFQEKHENSKFIANIALCKIGSSTVLLHKSIFEDIGVFDENLVACEDYDLWLRILRKYEVGLVNEKLLEKIAGHRGQLSFETIGMDYYRILALQKHIDSEFKIEVLREISLKKEILLKGALKHKNQIFIDFCDSL